MYVAFRTYTSRRNFKRGTASGWWLGRGKDPGVVGGTIEAPNIRIEV